MNIRKRLVALLLVVACGGAHAEDSLEQRLEALQKEVERLREEVQANKVAAEKAATEDAAKKEAELEAVAAEKIEIEEMMRETREPKTFASPDQPYMGPADRAKAQEGYRATTIGGYGEINYNNYKDNSRRDEFDLQRFIIFLGHKFNDRTRLFSEIEFEHSYTKGGDSKSGEVAMEQAFIEYDLVTTGAASLRTGLQLLPIGNINEYHEPPIFYGVERNEIETRIIPSTWRELGVGARGFVLSGLEYNAGFSTTPDASLYTDASAGFRSMRAQGNRVSANDFGLYAGLNYRGIPGLLLGGGLFTGNTAQNGQGKGANPSALQNVDANLTVWDLHVRYDVAGWNLRALYSQGSLEDTLQINAAAGLAPGSNDAAPESFSGWLVEAAYNLYRRGDIRIVPFARYEDYNTQESVAPGYTIDPNNDEDVATLGISFYVHPQVVFKADVQDYGTDDKKDRFNVGLGWMF